MNPRVEAAVPLSNLNPLRSPSKRLGFAVATIAALALGLIAVGIAGFGCSKGFYSAGALNRLGRTNSISMIAFGAVSAIALLAASIISCANNKRNDGASEPRPTLGSPENPLGTPSLVGDNKISSCFVTYPTGKIDVISYYQNATVGDLKNCCSQRIGFYHMRICVECKVLRDEVFLSVNTSGKYRILDC